VVCPHPCSSVSSVVKNFPSATTFRSSGHPLGPSNWWRAWEANSAVNNSGSVFVYFAYFVVCPHPCKSVKSVVKNPFSRLSRVSCFMSPLAKISGLKIGSLRPSSATMAPFVQSSRFDVQGSRFPAPHPCLSVSSVVKIPLPRTQRIPRLMTPGPCSCISHISWFAPIRVHP